eukprot:Gb_07277 [translate_table: standard]
MTKEVAKIVDKSVTTELNKVCVNKPEDGEGKEEARRDKEADKSKDKDREEKDDRVAESLEMALHVYDEEKVDHPEKITESFTLSEEPDSNETCLEMVSLSI